MIDPGIFKNSQLDVGSLPRMEDIEYQGLLPSYRTLVIIYRLIFFAVFILATLILALFFPENRRLFLLLAGCFFLLAIVAVLWVIKAFPYHGYALREHDIVYKKGWLMKRWTTVPFNRVQHVDVKQGLLERSFALSTLNVYTAGGQSSDLSLPGLSPKTASRLKAYILKTVASDEEE